MTNSAADLLPAETVRRSNETIAVRPTAGKITAVTRRLFNAMLYFSQHDGPRDVYRRSLVEIMELAKYTSRNTADVKDQLRAMQGYQVEWNSQNESEKRWGVSGMIAQAEVIEAGKGSMVYVEWSLPPKIRDQLLDPQFYTRLSLQIHSSLRSGASIALYEICSRYATNPSKVTMREHWEWWRPRLTGNPEEEAYSEYKYFKRDVLKAAITEVNALADIEIELLEFKNGKRVEDIQFKVIRKSFPLLDMPEEKPVDGELLEQIMRLGIKLKEARELYAEHEIGFLRKTVIHTEQRAASPDMPALVSKAAYFKKALQGRFVDSLDAMTAPVAVEAPKTPQETQEAKKERLMAHFRSHRIKTAYDAYKELDVEDQAAMRDAFRQVTPVAGFRSEIKQHGLGRSEALKTSFCEWYAEHLWGKATDSDFLAFMMQNADLFEEK